MQEERTYLNIAFDDGDLTVAIVGEVDHHAARGLREQIDRNLILYRPRRFCLALGDVSFMDSSGLGLILGRYSRAQEIGAEMVLKNVSERTMKILTMAGATRLRGLTIEREGAEKSASYTAQAERRDCQ